ncbi:hypothetical protein GHK49_12220 [Sinorhizobium fredii]|nr:hypothetical protein [Sinorhizobium fredii]
MVPPTKPAPIARMVRLPIPVCLADTDGSDRRALAGELAKARLTRTASVLSCDLQTAMRSPHRPRGPARG